MAQLHEIQEVRVYCGPAAIMAITGKRLPEVRSAINAARGMRDNQGVIRLSLEHLEDSLNKLGVKFEKSDGKMMPLRRFMADLIQKDVRYILHITGHYITVLNGLIIDNHYRFGTNINDCRWAGKKIKNIYRIIDGENHEH